MKTFARFAWAGAALFFVAAVAGAEAPRKVVVLGFDGADPALVRKYMAAGDLPNLKKLSEQGTFKDLKVTNPPQTPVSWGAFMTGLNPGKNHVFDFLVRDVKTYKPSFALMEEGSNPFLLGKANRWAIPLGVFVVAFILAWGASRLAKRKGRWVLGASLALGLILGAGTYTSVGQYIPSRIPKPINHLVGTPFWETAAATGKKCLVFRVPDTFPAKPYRDGRLLAGLGVPDMRGRVGTPFIFTTDAVLSAGTNEFSVDIVALPPGAPQPILTKIQGPFNKPFYEYAIHDAGEGATDPSVVEKLRQRTEEKLKAGGIPATIDIPLSLAWDAAKGQCSYDVQGQRATLKVGQWSEWVVLEFPFNPLLRLKGMARFYLLSVEPNLRLYMSPVHFHPDNHGVAISYPPRYAEDLLKRFGFFKTMGWAEDTWTISSGLADEEQFLSDMNQTVDAYEAMMKGLLKDGDWDLYVQVFEFTDRTAHVLWRYLDPQHPMYDAAKAPKYAEALRQAYIRMDKIVGEAAERLPEGATFIVLSDHGFTSFRRAVNTNRWLIDHGYLVLTADTGTLTLQDLFDDNRLLFKNVDWSKTKAYALGLGNVYINLKGREAHGIVVPGAEYEELLRKLKAEIPAMADPENGEKPVFAVYTRDELYKGYDPDLTPDLRVTNTPGYRVSWQTSLGGAPEKLIEANDKAWSGDHCSLDPSFVPGIFFTNRKVAAAPKMLDLAPTILSALGVQASPGLEGEALAWTVP